MLFFQCNSALMYSENENENEIHFDPEGIATLAKILNFEGGLCAQEGCFYFWLTWLLLVSLYCNNFNNKNVL